MRSCTTLAAASATAVIMLAGCGAAAKPAPRHTAQAAAKASPLSCSDQVIAWRDDGGLADLQGVIAALSEAAKRSSQAASGLSGASLSRLGTAAAQLQAAAQTAQSDPPPACAPRLRADAGAAMADYTRGAQGELDAVQADQNGDLSTAGSDLQAAMGSFAAGGKKMQAATTDISNLTGN